MVRQRSDRPGRWRRCFGVGRRRGGRAPLAAGAAGRFDRRLSPDSARALAARLGAGRLLLGSLVSTGDRATLSGALVDVADGQTIQHAVVEGPADSLLDLVDGLAAGVLITAAGEPESRLDALTTTSLPALHAYLRDCALQQRCILHHDTIGVASIIAGMDDGRTDPQASRPSADLCRAVLDVLLALERKPCPRSCVKRRAWLSRPATPPEPCGPTRTSSSCALAPSSGCRRRPTAHGPHWRTWAGRRSAGTGPDGR